MKVELSRAVDKLGFWGGSRLNTGIEPAKGITEAIEGKNRRDLGTYHIMWAGA